MSRPRNFVSELKEAARAWRTQAGLPDDWDGMMPMKGQGNITLLQYNEGFLSGVVIIPDENLAGFAEQIAALVPQGISVDE